MLKKIMLLTALISSIYSFQAFAAQEIQGWTFMASTNEFNYYVKNGSLKEKQNSREMLIQQVPISQVSNSSVSYKRFSVPLQACKDEYGEITMYDLGGRVVAKIDYVKGGSSAAAYMGDIVCLNLDKHL